MVKFEDSKNSCEGYNFYHGDDNGINAYGGMKHGHGNFTPKRYIGVGNFSPHARSYEHNSYDCYEGNKLGARNCYNDTSCKRVPRNKVRNEGMNGRFHKRRDDYEGYCYSYNYVGPISYNNLKLLLLVELLVLMIMQHGRKKWNPCFIPVDCKCQNKRRMGAQRIKTWSLMKQALRTKFRVENYERPRQGQAKEKFMESSI
ncbi:hypothetical protein M9H77_30322 [Catharanthus roseus]|uniref:Uncharacterized protein n=1 Tax=Catharanthus roseus TaxID=4058 RepID=A0ACB9ZYS7_CATRO|nr:hypothetical protein M9H77_30322 [Catharanthus roseus]